MATKQTSTTTPSSPFGEFDFSQFDVTKMLKSLNILGMDVQALLDTQRKNRLSRTSRGDHKMLCFHALPKSR